MFSIFLPAGGSKGPHLHWNLFRSCCILFQVQFVFMIGRFGSILQVCMLFYYFWVMRVGFYGSYKINAFYWILYESLESCLLFLHCWIHASFIQRKTSANVPVIHIYNSQNKTLYNFPVWTKSTLSLFPLESLFSKVKFEISDFIVLHWNRLVVTWC